MKIFSLNLWLLRIVWLLNKIHKTTWWIDPEVFTLSLTPSIIELNLSMLRSTIKPTVLNNLQYHDEQSCRHQLPTSTNQLPAAMNLGIHRSKSSAYHEFGDCWFPGSEEKIGGTAPHPTRAGCGITDEDRRAGEELSTAGEETTVAGVGTGGGTGTSREGSSGSTSDEAGGHDGAVEDDFFSPRWLPARPFPPLMEVRRPELAAGAIGAALLADLKP